MTYFDLPPLPLPLPEEGAGAAVVVVPPPFVVVGEDLGDFLGGVLLLLAEDFVLEV